MSLRANVLAAVVTATAALVLTLLVLGDPILELRMTTRARADLQGAARRALVEVQHGQDPDAVADRVGGQRGCRLTLLDPAGRVVGDTILDGDALAEIQIADRPEVVAALESGEGFAQRAQRGGGSARLFEAVRSEGAPPWIARASRSSAAIDAARSSARELLVLGGIIAALASALLAFALSRNLVRPVERLTRAADALASGDLSVRTHAQRQDELGKLGRSLDHMADLLEERMGAVRAEEARLRTILDAMVEGVVVTDRRGTIVLTNPAFDALASKSAEGHTLVEAIRSRELGDAASAARHGQAVSVEIEVSVAHEDRVIAAELAPLPENRGVVGVLHDVTALKRADKVRRDFVANASHELRTPLTAIRGFAETLRSGEDIDAETRARFLDTILRHASRLQALVDDLLALSRAESDDARFELGPVSVGPIVAEAAASLEALARGRGVSLEVEALKGLPDAMADAWALEQVVINLLDNALKYTPRGGRVCVRGRPEGDRLQIEVSDTGPGITPHQRERIFERFYRVDGGRARVQGGTGLGLSIVKHLLQRMDAEIEVDSVPGRGATFRISLPRV